MEDANKKEESNENKTQIESPSNDTLKKEEPKLYKQNTALTDKDLAKFCKRHDLHYHMINISDLENNKYDMSYVYTGDEKNETNGGNPHHWLFVVGTHIFDSYGKTSGKNAYKLPENFKIFRQKPNRLQTYGTNVCGEYCSLFYKFINENGNESAESDYAQEFINHYNFTSNTIKNDETTLEEFEK
jgi:hypothetical protein